MSLKDFCHCTPHEFDCIYRSWERTQVREPWERMRFLACCVLQPYSKKTLKATDVCRFGWENELSGKEKDVGKSTPERFEELKNRVNR